MSLLTLIFLFTLPLSCKQSAKRTNIPETPGIAAAAVRQIEDTLAKTLYPNGTLASCIIKKDSAEVRERHLVFYQNGVLKEKGHQGYVANKDIATNSSVGTWYSYDSTGRLLMETVYHNLVFDSAFIEVKKYHANGKIQAVEKYNNHVLYETEIKEIGEWQYFDAEGTLIKTKQH